MNRPPERRSKMSGRHKQPSKRLASTQSTGSGDAQSIGRRVRSITILRGGKDHGELISTTSIPTKKNHKASSSQYRRRSPSPTNNSAARRSSQYRRSPSPPPPVDRSTGRPSSPSRRTPRDHRPLLNHHDGHYHPSSSSYGTSTNGATPSFQPPPPSHFHPPHPHDRYEDYDGRDDQEEDERRGRRSSPSPPRRRPDRSLSPSPPSLSQTSLGSFLDRKQEEQQQQQRRRQQQQSSSPMRQYHDDDPYSNIPRNDSSPTTHHHPHHQTHPPYPSARGRHASRRHSNSPPRHRSKSPHASSSPKRDHSGTRSSPSPPPRRGSTRQPATRSSSRPDGKEHSPTHGQERAVWQQDNDRMDEQEEDGPSKMTPKTTTSSSSRRYSNGSPEHGPNSVRRPSPPARSSSPSRQKQRKKLEEDKGRSRKQRTPSPTRRKPTSRPRSNSPPRGGGRGRSPSPRRNNNTTSPSSFRHQDSYQTNLLRLQRSQTFSFTDMEGLLWNSHDSLATKNDKKMNPNKDPLNSPVSFPSFTSSFLRSSASLFVPSSSTATASTVHNEPSHPPRKDDGNRLEVTREDIEEEEEERDLDHASAMEQGEDDLYTRIQPHEQQQGERYGPEVERPPPLTPKDSVLTPSQPTRHKQQPREDGSVASSTSEQLVVAGLVEDDNSHHNIYQEEHTHDHDLATATMLEEEDYDWDKDKIPALAAAHTATTAADTSSLVETATFTTAGTSKQTTTKNKPKHNKTNNNKSTKNNKRRGPKDTTSTHRDSALVPSPLCLARKANLFRLRRPPSPQEGRIKNKRGEKATLCAGTTVGHGTNKDDKPYEDPILVALNGNSIEVIYHSDHASPHHAQQDDDAPSLATAPTTTSTATIGTEEESSGGSDRGGPPLSYKFRTPTATTITAGEAWDRLSAEHSQNKKKNGTHRKEMDHAANDQQHTSRNVDMDVLKIIIGNDEEEDEPTVSSSFDTNGGAHPAMGTVKVAQPQAKEQKKSPTILPVVPRREHSSLSKESSTMGSSIVPLFRSSVTLANSMVDCCNDPCEEEEAMAILHGTLRNSKDTDRERMTQEAESNEWRQERESPGAVPHFHRDHEDDKPIAPRATEVRAGIEQAKPKRRNENVNSSKKTTTTAYSSVDKDNTKTKNNGKRATQQQETLKNEASAESAPSPTRRLYELMPVEYSYVPGESMQSAPDSLNESVRTEDEESIIRRIHDLERQTTGDVSMSTTNTNHSGGLHQRIALNMDALNRSADSTSFQDRRLRQNSSLEAGRHPAYHGHFDNGDDDKRRVERLHYNHVDVDPSVAENSILTGTTTSGSRRMVVLLPDEYSVSSYDNTDGPPSRDQKRANKYQSPKGGNENTPRSGGLPSLRVLGIDSHNQRRRQQPDDRSIANQTSGGWSESVETIHLLDMDDQSRSGPAAQRSLALGHPSHQDDHSHQNTSVETMHILDVDETTSHQTPSSSVASESHRFLTGRPWNRRNKNDRNSSSSSTAPQSAGSLRNYYHHKQNNQNKKSISLATVLERNNTNS